VAVGAIGRRTSSFGYAIAFFVGLAVAGLVVPYVRTQAVTEQTATVGAGPTAATLPGGAPVTLAGGAPITVPGGAAVAGGVAGTGDGAVGPSGGVADPAAAAAGPEVGVTDTEIRIGISILDPGAAEQFGASFNTGDEEGRWNALIDHANAEGGIFGRQIVPVYRTIDIVSHPVESAQAACVGWTEDDQVFAVLFTAQILAETVVCITGQGATPLFTSEGQNQAYYGNGLLFTSGPSDERLLLDQAHHLIDSGRLDGRTIGILSGDGTDQQVVNSALIPAIEAAGSSIADVEVVPGTVDGGQRLPVTMSNFKANGVDLIIAAANSTFVGPAAQGADRSNYHPDFAVSDFNYQVNDALSSYFPDSFDGQTGLSIQSFPSNNSGLPPSPQDADCLARMSGVDDPGLADQHSLAYGLATIQCSIFDPWLAAMRNTGGAVTRAGLIAGAESLGSFPIPNGLQGSWGPGKHDAGDEVREVVWRVDCKCWQLAQGASTPTRPLS
jgi:hypothetical protein